MFALAALLIGAALAQAAPILPPASTTACNALTAEEIHAVQNDTVKDRKSSEHTAKGLLFSQCVFAATDVGRSVSLTVITDRTASANAGSVRAYWDTIFGPGQKLGRKNPPKAVVVGGKEAFWTSDARAGVLYVLNGPVVLRVSVGGVADDGERLERSKRLAEAALTRL